MPLDLVIDLGEEQTLTGFKYLPGQEITAGIISHFRFFVSNDGKQWEMAEGEFPNIKDNPLWQTKNSKEQKARYIKLQATQNTEENDGAGYGELDVITR